MQFDTVSLILPGQNTQKHRNQILGKIISFQDTSPLRGWLRQNILKGPPRKKQQICKQERGQDQEYMRLNKRRPGLAFGSPASRRCAAGRFQVQVSDSDLSLLKYPERILSFPEYYFCVYLCGPLGQTHNLFITDIYRLVQKLLQNFVFFQIF